MYSIAKFILIYYNSKTPLEDANDMKTSVDTCVFIYYTTRVIFPWLHQ